MEAVSPESVTFVTGIMTGMIMYAIYCYFKSSSGGNLANDNSLDDTEFSFSDGSGETKMVLVVRNDLKMGKGKAAAQCSHAAVMAHKIATNKQPNVLKEWTRKGQRKIVVKCESEDELLQLANAAKKLGLVHALVRDAGLTQIQSGSLTVLAVGPGHQHLVDKVTSHLKLY